MLSDLLYPVRNEERDKWILERRPERLTLNPMLPYAFSVENERSAGGEVVPVGTIFLTNRECPWRCLMCDLWRNTLPERVPIGAIPAQIDHALANMPPARHIKLYNSGSFFDAQAIPHEDYEAIAERLRTYERVIVECHPALVGESCSRFRDLLTGRLEVAMGLETAQPEILAMLNKRMTLSHFSEAAEWLRRNDIDLRAFILVKPPFMGEDEALYWAQRSLDFAFDCGASAATLIPTRTGNGAMNDLVNNGQFAPPAMSTLESAAQYGIELNKGRVFVDLWDLKRVSRCEFCFEKRRQRLDEMNLWQSLRQPIGCGVCKG